ncbi:unnamed protein product [Porites lobata]|uniref:G-protein coupled receptors family 1 profile domain-containing protein n=1 Tax=Porites lobata TaxID=104759 RepID=A0ABN8QXR2_9CNID|nr:unnamed protein product [Porites lobata]
MTTKRAMNASARLFFLITGVFIAVSFVISCASYIKIYIIVRHHQIQIHAQQQAVNSFNISFNITDSNNLIISKKRALKTFIYFICMIFCYLPYLSYLLLRETSVIASDRNWLNLVTTVVFLNSSVNPFLYCWCNHEIRTSVVKIIRKMITPSLRSVPSIIFLCSLASTDFLLGLVGQPFYIANELYHSTGGPISKVEDFVSVSLCGVSLTTITAISVDRLLALHYHMTYPNLMTTKRAMYASASLWFPSVLLACLRVAWGSEVICIFEGV